ncbi:MAG: DMT family transporter [Actinobacteria bacterium]|nr:DMT family transporter [Actinomycetota bacterium]
MSAGALTIGFCLFAGVAGALQVVINGALGGRIGVLEATAFNLILSSLLLITLVFAVRQTAGGITAAVREPPWLWLGGVMGAIIVTAITLGPPRIGTFATIALLIAGQLAMGVVIDALGLFGVARIPVSWERALGVALLALGAFLVVKR